MHSSSEIMMEIREEQLARGMKYFAVLILFVVVASLSRAVYFGWNRLMYIHIGYFLLMSGIAVSNKFIPYNVKAVIILGTTFILAISGLGALGRFLRVRTQP